MEEIRSPRRPPRPGVAGEAVPLQGPAPPADVEVTDTSGEPGGAVVTRVLPGGADSRLKRYEPMLPGAYRRGGGPGSPSGRAAASANALTHGAYSALPRDSRAYLERLGEVRQSLEPGDALSESAAAEVAHATIRRDLLREHEARKVALMVELGPPLGDVASLSGFPFGERHHHLMAPGLDMSRLRRELRRLWREHLYVAASGGLGLAREGLAVFGEGPLAPHREADFFARWDEAVSLAPHGAGPLHGALRSDAGEAFQARLWLYRHYHRVNKARDMLTSQAVVEFLGSTSLGRARSLIDRSVREGVESMQRARDTARDGRPWGGGGDRAR